MGEDALKLHHSTLYPINAFETERYVLLS